MPLGLQPLDAIICDYNYSYPYHPIVTCISSNNIIYIATTFQLTVAIHYIQDKIYSFYIDPVLPGNITSMRFIADKFVENLQQQPSPLYLLVGYSQGYMVMLRCIGTSSQMIRAYNRHV